MSEKKENVIKAARFLFSKYGYRKVSMDEIAGEANVSKKTIYTYFKDKNDLIRYFLVDEINEMNKLADEIDKKDIPFEDKIHELIMVQLDYRNNSKLLGTLLQEVEQGKLVIDEESQHILNKTIQEKLKIRLDKAIKDGYVKDCDTEIVAFLIYKIYVALMFELDKPIDRDEVSESIMNILKAWILK